MYTLSVTNLVLTVPDEMFSKLSLPWSVNELYHDFIKGFHILLLLTEEEIFWC